MEMVSVNRSAYTADEVAKRRTHEVITRPFGSRTVFNSRSDWRRSGLTAEKVASFYRLARINSSCIDGKERNYQEAMPYMKMLCDRLSVPGFVESIAWKIYAVNQEMRLITGRSIRAAVAASIYIACRVENVIRGMDDFRSGDFTNKDFKRALLESARKVLPALGLKYKPLEPRDFVLYFGNTMHVKEIVKIKAIKIIKDAVKNGFNVMGKDPKGVASGALYLAPKMLRKEMEWEETFGIYECTQTEVAKACNVTEVTLRNRAKELKRLSKIL